MMMMTTTRMANSQDLPPSHPDESIRAQTKIDSDPNVLLEPVPLRQTSSDPPRVPVSQTWLRWIQDSRRLSLACLALAPLIALPFITRVLTDRFAPTLADITTTSLNQLFAWREIAKPEENTPEPFDPGTSPPTDEVFVEPNPTPQATSNPPKRHRGILVRTDAVVRAVRSGGRPSSVPAPASGARPAGLSLVGVSHYGTGLRDGDILTSVGGTPATSESLVVALVAGAIGQGAKVITGVVWRDNQRMDVAVEIPGPEAFTKKKRRRPSSVRD